MENLKVKGFEIFNPFQAISHLGYLKEWEAVKKEFSELPLDPFCDPNYIRKRRYSYAYINSHSHELTWPPDSYDEQCVYYQGNFNNEHKDIHRKFPSISIGVRRNPILKLLIDNDFNRTFWRTAEVRQYRVGIHLVRLMVTPHSPRAVASPDVLHRDGEAFTFVHLVNRQGVSGGENTVATIDAVGLKAGDATSAQIHARFVLERDLDSFAVCDDMVCHAVDSVVLADGADHGFRDVILIDFTPVLPVLGMN